MHCSGTHQCRVSVSQALPASSCPLSTAHMRCQWQGKCKEGAVLAPIVQAQASCNSNNLTPFSSLQPQLTLHPVPIIPVLWFHLILSRCCPTLINSPALYLCAITLVQCPPTCMIPWRLTSPLSADRASSSYWLVECFNLSVQNIEPTAGRCSPTQRQSDDVLRSY